MSTQNLSSIALDVVGQYHQAGQYLVRAYQDQVQRTARIIDERFADVLQNRAIPLLDEEVRAHLIQAQQQLAGIVLNGLATGTSRAAALNDRVAETARNGIERIGAARIDSAVLAQAVESAAAISRPAAQLALSVASAVSQGARRIGERTGEIEETVDAVVVEEQAERPASLKRARARARSTV